MNRKGELILKWGEEGTLQAQFDYPRDIAVDSSGFIYVYDTNNHRIQKFNSNGKFVLFIGYSQIILSICLEIIINLPIFCFTIGYKLIVSFISTGVRINIFDDPSLGDAYLYN